MMIESGSTGTSARAAKSGETARALLRRTKQITRRKFAAEEKIGMLLEGIRAELSVAVLCRHLLRHPLAPDRVQLWDAGWDAGLTRSV